ncbi:MAG TPA: ABC transporter ATP-binding protein [Pyrinomonadaceae bacterium]|nr:ABC transporter ATP-binding protein [Pyrinomonadaceae bacterium]
MRPIIRVENISKRYIIDPRSNSALRYDTLRESMVNVVRSSFSRLGRNGHTKELFWALKNISFEVNPGEVLGIIGPNGAGKSTLLQILSRIVEPTSGYAELYGQVGSLLEIGTGFHPDLTGRENIFLNGAVLGMKRSEINARFDEIVAFSGIERFLETAVKRYSSGMYVRLAFSVAAHFNPEILIIDEVLAVGDAEFQLKCFTKMREVIKSGRTILLVTHSMPVINQLCQNAMLIRAGRLEKIGPAAEVVDYYQHSVTPPESLPAESSSPIHQSDSPIISS